MWPGQRARELLLLAGASVRAGLLAQAVRGFKERCKADGNPAHAEGERRRSGWQEWASFAHGMAGGRFQSLGAVLTLGAALPMGAALGFGPWQGYGTPWRA